MDAAVPAQEMTSLVQLGSAGQVGAMALSARRLRVTRGQNGLFPRQRAAVSFFDSGRRALPAMANHAAELLRPVRDRGMPAKRLGGDIRQARFFQTNVAGRATVYDSKLGKPYLLNAALKMTLQSDRLAASTDHL